MNPAYQSTLQNDTICAVSTAYGNGALAVVRMSGNKAIHICSIVFRGNQKDLNFADIASHTLHFGKIFTEDNILLDEVVVGVFRNPHSYTGEDIVEISCHGSLYIQDQIMKLLIRSGARAATPGEFTKRAFLNGKMDLAQAEAVADLISSNSSAAHILAIQQMKGGFSKQIKNLRDGLIEFVSLLELELDFSEEDVEFVSREKIMKLLSDIRTEVSSLLESYSMGNVIKSGIPVAIIGKPNVGKSTLLNIFLKEDRAIVSEIPGTTRDTIEDTMNIRGLSFRFIDTAGLREAEDHIENLGVERTYEKIALASVIIYMFDINDNSITKVKAAIEEFKSRTVCEHKKIIIVANKIDQLMEYHKDYNELVELGTIFISARRRENIHLITDSLLRSVDDNFLSSDATIVTNSRHYEALLRSVHSLNEAVKGMEEKISNDLLATHIRSALHHLGVITGDITTEDILDSIFSKFCIGK